MKKLLLLVIMVLEAGSSFGRQSTYRDTSIFTIQTGARIVYLVENTSGTKNQFLIPVIESELKKLNDTLQRNIFESVNGLNYLLAGNEANGRLKAIMWTFSKNFFHFAPNPALDRQNKLIVQELKKSQFFLKININSLNSLLEFQFILFRITPGVFKKKNFLDLPYYRTTSVFIDPSKTDYSEKLRIAIKQVIIEANVAPNPYVTINNNILRDTIYVEPGHFTLNAEANDQDSFDDQLSYEFSGVRINPDSITRKYPDKLYVAGKKLDIYINTFGQLNLNLKVSDGINNAYRHYCIFIVQKPIIVINYTPRLNRDVNFINGNTYALYSYHRSFKTNDFTSLIEIKEKTKSRFQNAFYYDDWSVLIPRLSISSDVVHSYQLSLSSTKYNIQGDSIARKQEKDIHFVGTTSGGDINDYFQLLGKHENLVDSTKYEKWFPRQHNFEYSIWINNHAKEKVPNPSVQLLKIAAFNQGISNYTSMRLQFHRVSRLNPSITESFNFFKLRGKPLNFFLLGAGAEYILLPQLKISGFCGSMSPIDNNASYRGSFFYKFDASINLINFKNVFKGSILFSSLNKRAYSYPPDSIYVKVGSYNSRQGIGLSIQPIIDRYTPFDNFAMDFFCTYYFPAGQFPNRLVSSIEAGLKFKYYFVVN